MVFLTTSFPCISTKLSQYCTPIPPRWIWASSMCPWSHCRTIGLDRHNEEVRQFIQESVAKSTVYELQVQKSVSLNFVRGKWILQKHDPLKNSMQLNWIVFCANFSWMQRKSLKTVLRSRTEIETLGTVAARQCIVLCPWLATNLILKRFQYRPEARLDVWKFS